jgi:type IV pilus assembly protein PilA
MNSVHNSRGFTLVELMIVVAIIGILAAIAIPNFLRFQARSRQAEAKVNLKAIFTGQKSRYSEDYAYSVNMGTIGFRPERGNRYEYDVGLDAAAGGTCAAADAADRTASVEVVQGQGCAIGADVFRYGASYAYPNAGALTNAGVVSVDVVSTGSSLFAAPSAVLVGVSDSTTCPLCSFYAAARGNIDGDTGLDAFLVSSEFISVLVAAGCADQTINQAPGGVLSVRNDVSCD